MATHRVYVADKLSPQGVAILEQHPDIEVDNRPGLSLEEKKAALDAADGLIVRSATTLDGDLLHHCDKLKLVIRAGIGVDNIDIPGCTAKMVLVENTPFGNATSAAEHAIALLFALARDLPRADAGMKAGKWEKKAFMGLELDGKTLGVIGTGNIGSIVIKKAVGIGMTVIGYDPFLSDDKAKAMGITKVELDELLARADAITLHVPLTDETRGIVGTAAFAKMKKGVLLVNASRGGTVDETALLKALDDGIVRGAALDVFEKEPLAADHPLRARADVILTPHLGASTSDAQDRVAVQAAQQMIAYLTEGKKLNALNDV